MDTRCPASLSWSCALLPRVQMLSKCGRNGMDSAPLRYPEHVIIAAKSAAVHVTLVGIPSSDICTSNRFSGSRFQSLCSVEIILVPSVLKQSHTVSLPKFCVQQQGDLQIDTGHGQGVFHSIGSLTAPSTNHGCENLDHDTLSQYSSYIEEQLRERQTPVRSPDLVQL